jgi:RimJ/RimL family protein N-acetyltransferase
VIDANVVLKGEHVRLEPLGPQHIDGLEQALQGDRSLYEWSMVPNGRAEVERYIQTALAWRDGGTAVPFATVRIADGAIIGSTRFFEMECWAWPPGHERHGCALDGCEIGYTWLAPSAIRTGANTEAKLLMLTHAFETWGALRVCLHTDARNARSRAAIERIGAQFEGILRSHRLAADFTPRNSARYSIIASEWPQTKHRLQSLLTFMEP